LLRKVFSLLCLFTLFCYVGIIQAQPITAKSWVVSNAEGQILEKANADEIRSIASISKLIVSMVVLDSHQDLDEVLPLTTKIKDRLPSQLTRSKLLELALVSSNNRAAQTLCEQYPGGFNVCVYAMNQKLRSLGMENSLVYEPTGLDKRNVSTATELVELVKAASHYSFIVDTDKKSDVEVKVKKRKIVFHNTNPIIHKKPFEISKTGWIEASGGCIVSKINNAIIIILGSRNTHTRINEVAYLYELHKRRIV
jgi:serine-type D-Ala-D-Ala endopeptidase (penicillin-binding protein 7)